ncbi:MAG: glycosyltransferase family 2 protein [Candidatus Micrarchaeota archaeon]|nr:glycosyltransferase family 2 protein [Candidatus Micrarchaeota archaeon]
MEKQLSVCIPTFNRKNKLKLVVDSICSQVSGIENEVEICISDNASTDGTSDYLDEVKKNSPIGIIINRNKKNLGMDANILNAFNLATGRYMWLLGDDDQVVKGTLKKLIDFLKEIKDDNIALVYLKVYGNSKNTISSGEPNWITSEEMVTRPNHFMSTDVIQRKVFNELDKKMVAKGLSTGYIHAWIIRLMGVRSPEVKGLHFEIPVVLGENSYTNASLVQQLRFSKVMFSIYSMFFFGNLMLPIFRKKYSIFFIKKILLSMSFPFFEMLCERVFRPVTKEFPDLRIFINIFGISGILLYIYYKIIRITPNSIANLILKISLSVIKLLKFTRNPHYEFWKEFWVKNMEKEVDTSRSFFEETM